MTSFENRLALAAGLEQAFIGTFNDACQSHQIIKFGIESTKLADAHQHLRRRYDATSRFLRYMPDSVLINLIDATAPTALIEFKAADTGLYSQGFFERLKANCPEMEPPFLTIQDVFNVESEALNGYLELAKLGIPVIVVGHAMYRNDNPLRAQYAERIAVCNEYDPNRGAGSMGSGTLIKNANFASFVTVGEFFSREQGVDSRVLEAVENAVVRRR